MLASFRVCRRGEQSACRIRGQGRNYFRPAALLRLWYVGFAPKERRHRLRPPRRTGGALGRLFAFLAHPTARFLDLRLILRVHRYRRRTMLAFGTPALVALARRRAVFPRPSGAVLGGPRASIRRSPTAVGSRSLRPPLMPRALA